MDSKVSKKILNQSGERHCEIYGNDLVQGHNTTPFKLVSSALTTRPSRLLHHNHFILVPFILPGPVGGVGG